MQAETHMAAADKRTLRRLALWVAGLLAIGLVAVLLLVSSDDPSATLSIFTTRFLGIFIEAAPFLLLGTLTSGLIDSFLSPEDITRWLPRNPVLATVAGGFMGFAFPVCECGVVPVARRLFTKGLPMSVGIAFLLAAPVMNPVVFASTFIAFGFGPLLIGRFVLTALVAITVGLVFTLGARPLEVLRPQSLMPVMGGSSEVIPLIPVTRRKPLLVGLRDALHLAGDEFFEMGRYLIIGSLLAAAMQTLRFNMPSSGEVVSIQQALERVGQGPVISVLVMQALAFLLSVCSTVDAFLALAFANTFTTGSLLSFLTFGPMVDIKSTMMFLSVFRRRTVLYLILLPLLMTMLAGIWLNLNVPF